MIKVAEPPSRTIDCFAKQTYDVPPELLILSGEDDFMELRAHTDERYPVRGDSIAPVNPDSLRAIYGCFRIISQKDGDKRVVWCRKVIAEIQAAKKMFMDLISKGMVPYKVGVSGNASAEVMDEFDPTAEEVIFMPVRAIAGG